jgi:DNA excision repair protein ERCC-2
MVICNYPYILDNRVNGVIMKNVSDNAMLIIDEAHNIDDVCLESKTVRIDSFLLDVALKNLDQLKSAYQKQKDLNFENFKTEYNKLLA